MRHTIAFADRTAERAHASCRRAAITSGARKASSTCSTRKPSTRLQKSVRTGTYATFKSYTELIDEHAKNLSTLRGLLDFKPGEADPDRGSRVRSRAIVKRFKTGAMSYGSISKEAHETLAIAMNRIGGKSQHRRRRRRSRALSCRWRTATRRTRAIKQVASAASASRATTWSTRDELQIKMAQGAKPGEGGQLPGTKVYPWIAKTRGTTPGVGLISPPPHHDIYSIEDLARAHPRSQEREHATRASA